VAVYTEVSAETLSAHLAAYDVGHLVMAKGIAEGVSNSNFLVETSAGRFILTLYERRIDCAELPWFLQLMTHLADRALPVPRPIPDREGRLLHSVAGKPAALIEFLPGVSVSQPSAAKCAAVGESLARLHLAAADFAPPRPNQLSLAAARATLAAIGPRLDELEPGLAAEVAAVLAGLEGDWPGHLPKGIVHADLFPDNVLFLGDRLSGLIDFYFACTDLLAYDLAILRVAWAFSADGRTHDAGRDRALLAGYERVRALQQDERAHLSLLGQAAALRFLLTRAADWFETDQGALVTRKDPLAFARRLRHIREHG
jgi:homoserine kinase type II